MRDETDVFGEDFQYKLRPLNIYSTKIDAIFLDGQHFFINQVLKIKWSRAYNQILQLEESCILNPQIVCSKHKLLLETCFQILFCAVQISHTQLWMICF